MSYASWDVGKDDPHLRSDLREKGEQLPVIAFDFAFVKTTFASGETEQKYAITLVAVDADLFFVKVIPVLGKETSDYSATGPESQQRWLWQTR